MLEKTLESGLLRAVKRACGMTYKLEGGSRRGRPDRLVILPGGRIFFLELKRPDGKGTLSPKQEKELERLTALGCVARVIDSKEALKNLMREEGMTDAI